MNFKAALRNLLRNPTIASWTIPMAMGPPSQESITESNVYATVAGDYSHRETHVLGTDTNRNFYFLQKSGHLRLGTIIGVISHNKEDHLLINVGTSLSELNPMMVHVAKFLETALVLVPKDDIEANEIFNFSNQDLGDALPENSPIGAKEFYGLCGFDYDTLTDEQLDAKSPRMATLSQVFLLYKGVDWPDRVNITEPNAFEEAITNASPPDGPGITPVLQLWVDAIRRQHSCFGGWTIDHENDIFDKDMEIDWTNIVDSAIQASHSFDVYTQLQFVRVDKAPNLHAKCIEATCKYLYNLANEHRLHLDIPTSPQEPPATPMAPTEPATPTTEATATTEQVAGTPTAAPPTNDLQATITSLAKAITDQKTTPKTPEQATHNINKWKLFLAQLEQVYDAEGQPTGVYKVTYPEFTEDFTRFMTETNKEYRKDILHTMISKAEAANLPVSNNVGTTFFPYRSRVSACIDTASAAVIHRCKIATEMPRTKDDAKLQLLLPLHFIPPNEAKKRARDHKNELVEQQTAVGMSSEKLDNFVFTLFTDSDMPNMEQLREALGNTEVFLRATIKNFYTNPVKPVFFEALRKFMAPIIEPEGKQWANGITTRHPDFPAHLLLHVSQFSVRAASIAMANHVTANSSDPSNILPGPIKNLLDLADTMANNIRSNIIINSMPTEFQPGRGTQTAWWGEEANKKPKTNPRNGSPRGNQRTGNFGGYAGQQTGNTSNHGNRTNDRNATNAGSNNQGNQPTRGVFDEGHRGVVWDTESHGYPSGRRISNPPGYMNGKRLCKNWLIKGKGCNNANCSRYHLPNIDAAPTPLRTQLDRWMTDNNLSPVPTDTTNTPTRGG